jgi:hypothetical protein
MTASLDDLITIHWDELVDEIAKDAICQLPSYRRAPIRVTVGRAERWLAALRDSIRRNDPHLMAQFLAAVGEARREEGYAADEVQAIMDITERHLRGLVKRELADPIEQTAQSALLDAIIGSAQMVLNVSFVVDERPRIF